MVSKQKVWFITGASSGFGRALAEAVIARGERAVVAARRREVLATLTAIDRTRVLAVPLDVTDAAARTEAVAAAMTKFGRIDVLANIAGRGSLGATEEFAPDQLRAQMEVNFFGVVGMTRQVLPHMRAQGSGHILNLTSIGGLVSAGSFAAYSASKFAVEGWSEALRDEVAPLGIAVTLVEPGAFRTEFAGEVNMRPETDIEAYRPVIAPIEQYLYGQDGRQPGDPAKAAEVMIAAVEAKAPPLRLMLGADAYGMWEAKLAGRQAEFAAWRAVGEATGFEGAEAQTLPLTA